jgi:hypothetical protein
MSFRTPRHPDASIDLQISFAVLVSISSLFAYGTPHEKSALPTKPAQPLAHFTDMAKSAGLTMTNIFGGAYTKKIHHRDHKYRCRHFRLRRGRVA